ncbi:MAG: bifunctional homocysteine S-methyltransferase/methylenetetrahydrofolate reductase [Planctomycetia bacterium]|nr:bifunctional homocysteine S-methyltransferase/methylenetetrahydrofolate reductase [Planctomycetia bacterium]
MSPTAEQTRSQSLVAALKQNVLVFDGAMGTELYRHNVFTNQCYDELCIKNPGLVKQIHESYAQAGVDVLTTNTYGASSVMLERYGLADKTHDINLAGAKLAREVADRDENSTIFVAGSVGPHTFAAKARYTDGEIVEHVALQIAALIDGGCDVIIFESLPSRQALEMAARAMAPYPTVPYILSCCFANAIKTPGGDDVATVFAPLPSDLPQPLAFGLNCGQGPELMLKTVEAAMKVVTCPLIAQPNAGTPQEFEGRQLYYCSPEYLSTYAQRYVSMGVAAVGGCCGTTPEQIAEMARTIKPFAKAQRAGEASAVDVVVKAAELRPASPLSTRSALGKKLAAREWITTVELIPPTGYDLTATLEKCRMLRDEGVDAVNLPDGPRASARISSLIVADRIRHEVGLEPILHFCCRDRNLIGMQADLLGCAACDIRNILFITGDSPKLGNYPHATGVFDSDSIGMCKTAAKLNGGLDLGGRALPSPTNMVVGVGVDPSAINRPRELHRLHDKLAAGADFIITQPVFDPACLFTFLESYEKSYSDCPLPPIIAGVWPFASYKNFVFMKNEVPGVVVPDAIIKRMESASHGTREDQVAAGIEIACEMIEKIRTTVRGVQVSAPLGRLDISLAVLKSTKVI